MNAADPPALARPSLPGLSTSTSLRPNAKTQTSPRRAAVTDEKPRKVSPLPSGLLPTKTTPSTSKPTTTKLFTKIVTRGTSTTAKPLVPLSERRSREEKRSIPGKAENDVDRRDIAPDGSSAGREARQFTVANVGNNGRIYLRPSVRPAYQRYPQPNFTFPITPPSTAIVDSWTQSNKAKQHDIKKGVDEISYQTAPWTPTTSATPLASDGHVLHDAGAFSQPRRHRRAMSDSTVHEASISKEQEPHAFKVTISNAADHGEPRPRTMDDLDAVTNAPLLNVNIPSWRLGTPRFTLRGSPMLRGSSYAPTEDLRLSAVSGLNSSSRIPNMAVPGMLARRPNPVAVPTNRTPLVAQQGATGMPSPRLLRPLRSTYMSTQLVIEPAMFADLTFKPACDDRSIVRYSSAGAVTAATPPRLVAEITSPTFLDYELISDFFLSFRSFLEPSDLLRMLVARLRWALDQDDEIGMIVRVRTFVALRHWILNYFVDDFLLEYGLRVTFCNLLNDFVDELSQDMCSRRVQLKILAELKKCWRRVCAQFWDGDEFDDLLGPEVAITPGGIAASRDPHVDPATLDSSTIERDQFSAVAQQWQSSPQTHSASFRGETPKPIPVGDFVVLDNRPGTPENHIGGPFNPGQSPTSPQSQGSIDIVSCSFPGKSLKTLHPNTAHVMAAHPVTSASVGNATGPIATTPRTLVGKRVRPTQTHKRNNSLSDSLREHSSDRASSTDQEFFSAMPSGGSLVRGNLLPPGQAFVDVELAGRFGHAHRQTTVFQSKSHQFTKDGVLGGAMSGYGMRKLLRSARRALKNKGQGAHTTQPILTDIQPVGPRGATTNRIPGTAVVPHGAVRQNGSRPPVRIDLLGAEVAEDFKKAIREEEEAIVAATADRERFGGVSLNPPNSAPLLSTFPDSSSTHMDSTTLEVLTQQQRQRPVSDMAITVGSKSIVIVDDTVPFEMPSICGTSNVHNPSVDTIADSFIRRGADPTPPNTPPSQTFEGCTPRRSSYLLNHHIMRPPISEEDILPPFIPDLATLEGSQSTRVSEDLHRPSMPVIQQQEQQQQQQQQGRRRHPPSSGGTFRMHRRARSSKIHHSVSSILRRRAASFGSITVPPTLRSFDATTDSGDADPAHPSEVPIPAPLRLLRRRPGGDLKAATNIGDLDRPALRRSQSVGSLVTYTESIRSSYMIDSRPSSIVEVDSGTTRVPHGRADVFSLGQLADKPTKRDLSLFSTHSSKPIMRPSFEAEAQKLAQIPDDEDDGVESALLKLEGKFLPKRAIKLSIVGQSPEASEEHVDYQEQDDADANEKPPLSSIDGPSVYPTLNEETGGSGSPVDGQAHLVRPSVRALSSFLSDGSQDSYCSIPLLQRGLGDETSKSNPRLWTEQSILCGSDDEDSSDETEHKRDHDLAGEKYSSFNFVQKTESLEKLSHGETVPSIASVIEDESFLKDDSADDTDLSSELSEDNMMPREGDGLDGNAFAHGMPTHPLADEPVAQRSHSASPQITLVQALAIPPNNFVAPLKPGVRPKKPLPPTPELTPVMGCTESPRSTDELARSNEPNAGIAQVDAVTGRKHSVHLPFILAFDSNTLAQQFTLIEKDALTEIDWKELIDMNWKNCASSNSRSWVDFLRNIDAQGVDVVIARFNIMVKWAISEIVLTQHVEERARCIIKLIHIAAHCRRYRNFATLAQLTIALSSNEVSRLSKTWDLVPESDIKTLNDLEVLVTPSRNFHNIREEMEIGTNSGCIPFVGIYTHDLLYNAQRPSGIASSPTTAPLVNFERCRCGAAVVKTLLRLLEASTRYTFMPLEGVTERCLWIGALSDGEIRRYSQGLE
ncbi:Guanine nucleotide exchange factor lte1 [Conoideocrella luteorostrata]|uniref:Guanine nucleotide exchange factor lte1 n=1 Tax=Conoideocrella luteorostrata TaxID=1105319 RepID=A0AAJ0CGK7_9HYPO|nr:Guanine nucleotide exchange factor lte1 [Conoideocrella luteorostrata]